ncbi:hypothetical protein ACHAPT_005348 [Fusarium lateritium]
MAEVIERRFNITDGHSKELPFLQKWFFWETVWLNLINRVVDHPEDPLFLIDDGCQTKEYGINCTEACSKPTYLFGSPETLWNCVTLATLHITAWGNSDEARVQVTINVDSEKEARQRLRLGPLKDFDSAGVFRNYRACALESCLTSELGCSLGLGQFQGDSVTYDKTLELGSTMSQNYCTKADLGIDSDLAGPGIFVAYLVQFSLAIFFALSFNLATTWTKHLVWACSWPFCTADKAIETAKKWQGAVFQSRFAGAVASTVVDLQEAQTQYLAIISIVGVVAYASRDSPGLGNVQTFRTWHINNAILYQMVPTIMYPLIFIQVLLHKTHNRWWYTLLWVVFTWAMAIVITTYDTSNQAENVWRFREGAGLEACGQNPGPKIYCMSSSPADDFTYGHNEPYGLEVTVAGVLEEDVGYWAIHGLVPVLMLDWIFNCIFLLFPQKAATGVYYAIRELETFWTSMMNQVTWTAIELFAMGLGAYRLQGFVKFRREVGEAYGGGESDSVFGGWTFGQFVALFVWFPIIGKFLSIIIGKSEALP